MIVARHHHWFTIVCLGLAGLAHHYVHSSLISIVPLAVSVPLILTWFIPHPLPYLIAWSFVAEAGSTLPLGFMIIVSLIPFLLKSVLPSISVDLSFSFFVLLFITVSLQLALVFVPDILRAPVMLVSTIPWVPLLVTILVTTTTVYVLCLIREQMIVYE
jgi:hypothetical protein